MRWFIPIALALCLLGCHTHRAEPLETPTIGLRVLATGPACPWCNGMSYFVGYLVVWDGETMYSEGLNLPIFWCQHCGNYFALPEAQEERNGKSETPKET